MRRATVIRFAVAALLLLAWTFGTHRGVGQEIAVDTADESATTAGNQSTGDVDQASSDPSGLADKLPEELKPANFGVNDIAAANTMVESLHVADWLGPLAPVALSPFFGLACLSGLAIWGPEWLSGNTLLASAGPLKNEVVFGVFACLTVLTSLPRLTKVSKPLAQALDQVETYSVIVILVVIKLFADAGAVTEAAPVAAIQFGVVSFTAETLLLIAMVINLFVINSVKFFFEVLIWLTPIPAVDAMFEIANKAVCAGLMALYAFSATLATLINLAILVAALIVFRWTHRRLRFYRSILLDLFLSRIWSTYGKTARPQLVAFAKEGPLPFRPKTRWKLTREGERWLACQTRLFAKDREDLVVSQPPRLRRGWIMHSLTFKVSDSQAIEFHVSRRFDTDLEAWLALCGFELDEQPETLAGDVQTARAEFA